MKCAEGICECAALFRLNSQYFAVFGRNPDCRMSLSAQTLRSGPYSIPPPSANTCRLGSRPSVPGTYGAQTFSTQLQHHYNFNPNSSLSQTAAPAGFTFQNSMLLPGSQAGGSLAPLSTLPSSSISIATSMPLPDSPVSQTKQDLLCALCRSTHKNGIGR